MSWSFDAVVLAGGGSTRLGGIDKALATVGGVTLLDRVLTAVQSAGNIVCVGPERDTAIPVTWTREDPVGGGPVAALAAALPLVDAEIVVVMSVDAAYMTGRVVQRLLEACRDDGALLVDAGGHRQPLMGAYRSEFLRERIASLETPDGAAMHDLVKGSYLMLLDEPEAARDVDTVVELEAARQEIEP